MATFELLAIVYFAGLAAATLAAGPAPPRRRVIVAGAALAAAAFVAAVARYGGSTARAWLPHFYLVLGYWLPGWLAGAPVTATRFERWLVRSDERLRPVLPAVPAAILPAVELAYLFCYPLVPAAFAFVWALGGDDDVRRFWVAVLGAGYSSYATIPWLVSRPPRLVSQTSGALTGIAAVNVFVLGRVSHQLNTFPSGHVAVSLAAAAVVASLSPPAGLLFGLMAAAIGVGAAAGRYHYVIDVLLGAGVGAAAAAAAW